MAIDIEAFKAIWAEQDRKLDAILRLNRQLLNERALSRARSGLQRLAMGCFVEAALDLVGVVALGRFLYANATEPRFFAAGVVVDVLAIAAMAAAIGQGVLALRIDYARPVATIQTSLEALRVLRLRTLRWILLLSPLAWTPLQIVLLRGFFGIDGYALGAGYLWANVAFGLVVIAAGLRFAKTIGSRLSRTGPGAFIVRTLEGAELRQAIEAAAALREFERV